jgi:hypothetical protein
MFRRNLSTASIFRVEDKRSKQATNKKQAASGANMKTIILPDILYGPETWFSA